MTLIQDFTKNNFAGEDLVCFTEKDKNKDNDWKICLSDYAVLTSCSQIFSFTFKSPRKTRIITGYEYIDTFILI